MKIKSRYTGKAIRELKAGASGRVLWECELFTRKGTFKRSLRNYHGAIITLEKEIVANSEPLRRSRVIIRLTADNTGITTAGLLRTAINTITRHEIPLTIVAEDTLTTDMLRLMDFAGQIRDKRSRERTQIAFCVGSFFCPESAEGGKMTALMRDYRLDGFTVAVIMESIADFVFGMHQIEKFIATADFFVLDCIQNDYTGKNEAREMINKIGIRFYNKFFLIKDNFVKIISLHLKDIPHNCNLF